MTFSFNRMLKTMGLFVAVFLVLSCLAVFLMFYEPDHSPKPGSIRIACVGDSITFGLLTWPRAINTYPAQLQKLLGENYSVRNFGVNAHTAQKAADHPYWNNDDFQRSTDYAPNIVILMLGTNDAKTVNWKGLDLFLQDYSDLVAHYQSLPTKPTVYVMSPPAVFLVHGNTTPRFGVTFKAIDEITAGLKKFVERNNIGFIDINTATAMHAEYFTLDGIHPNVAGTKLIAETVYGKLKSKQ